MLLKRDAGGRFLIEKHAIVKLMNEGANMLNMLLKVATFRQLDITEEKYDINVKDLGHIGL